MFLNVNKGELQENFENRLKPIPKPNNWNSLGFNQKIKIYGLNLTKEHSFFADKLRVKNTLMI